MDLTLEALLEQIRERGDYPTLQEAARATQAVLTTLGAQLTAPDRDRLAALVPPVCAPLLTGTPPTGEPLTLEGFLAAVAARDGGDPDTALRDADAVLGALAETAGADGGDGGDGGDGAGRTGGEHLLRQLLDALPPDHTAPA